MILIVIISFLFVPSCVEPADDICWWTGCQKNFWQHRGCEGYNRVQNDVRDCANGQEYFCCPKSESGTSQVNSNPDEICWWTGCQKNNWKERGCGIYNRAQNDVRTCDDGQEYFCCPKSEGEPIKTTTAVVVQPTSAPNSEESCWWTGCQKYDWKNRGCDGYSRIQNGVRDCDDGQEFNCCPKSGQVYVETPPSHSGEIILTETRPRGRSLE